VKFVGFFSFNSFFVSFTEIHSIFVFQISQMAIVTFPSIAKHATQQNCKNKKGFPPESPLFLLLTSLPASRQVKSNLLLW